jgi:hypothetical protein
LGGDIGGLGTHIEASGIVAWFEALKRGFKPVLGGNLISDRWIFGRRHRWEVTLVGLGTHVEVSGIVAWFEALKPVLGGNLISDRWKFGR